MLENYLFISLLSIVSSIMIYWGIKNLPNEKWQFIATLPEKKEHDDFWKGINLTYYGLFNANSYTISVLIFLILTSAVQISPIKTVILTVIILGVCIPASKIVARIVENKQGTLTIGGASFVGIITTPIIITLLNNFFFLNEGKIPVLPVLAAMAVAYTFGESLGRLACLSFGCCYGKKLNESGQVIQNIFKNYYHIFYGKTKKISYASNLDGEKVIPVQSLTSIIYLVTGIISLLLFFNKFFTLSLILSVTVTQLWRFFSETLRADFRGNMKISAYQIMALISIFYAIVLKFIYKSDFIPKSISVTYSYDYLYNVPVLIFLEILWALTFLWTGKSIVTASKIKFYVNYDKV